MTLTTTDSIFKGQIIIHQPKEGFRFGIDAIILGAAAPVMTKGRLLDLGSGVGTALFSAHFRSSLATGVGVEIDASLVELARKNATENKRDDRLKFVEHDLLLSEDPLKGELYDVVITNPPFYDRDKAPASPLDQKSRAKSITVSSFKAWIEYGVKKTTSGGYFIALVPPAFLPHVMDGIKDKLGNLRLHPLWPKAGEAAKRVLIGGQKGSKTPFAILPGTVIHKHQGGYTEEAHAILQEGSSLALF